MEGRKPSDHAKVHSCRDGYGVSLYIAIEGVHYGDCWTKDDTPRSHPKAPQHAFIEFKSEEIARTALASINGKLVADRPVTAELCSERTSPPTQSGSSDLERRRPHWIPPDKRTLQDFCLTTLYVTCIPRVATQDDLRQIFDKAVTFDFNMNMKHNSIGSCRVVFSNEQEALEAFNSKHGFLLHDSPLIVNFAFRKHGRRKTHDGVSVPKESVSSVVKLKGASMQNVKPKKPEPKLLSEVQGIQKSKKDGQPKKTKHDKQPGLQNSTPKNMDLLKKKPVGTKKQKLAKARKQ
ncbi:unnamed protein product [Echinostoma caproni]|uniref:RRM domain-containing protein n=1 Tax=Echinostoma caproni TaxID=27848 RepID=A0A183AXG3_9TREM|nr:unnamed protein product [Echinostoma caproni]